MTFQLNEHDNSDMSRKKLVSHSVYMLFIFIFVLFNLSFLCCATKVLSNFNNRQQQYLSKTQFSHLYFPRGNHIPCCLVFKFFNVGLHGVSNL